MAVLGLDLGTSTGWALRDAGEQLHSGTWKLKPSSLSCDKTKELTLFRRLEATWDLHKPIELVAYEMVIAHGRGDEKKITCPQCKHEHSVRIQATNVLAAQVYGALRGILLAWADSHHIRVDSVHVGTLKLFATGKGNAKKDKMLEWAQLRWGREQNITTHDQADALHILEWAWVEVLGHKGKARVAKGGQLELGGDNSAAEPAVDF